MPTDYFAVAPPDEKDPADYTYVERRAEILALVVEAGTPAALTQTQLADRYDVADSTISRDMDALGDAVAGALGARAALTTRAAFEKILAELYAEEDWKAAWDVVMDWNAWLGDIGAQDRVADKLDASVTHSDDDDSSDYYTIIPDDEADAILHPDGGSHSHSQDRSHSQDHSQDGRDGDGGHGGSE